MMVILEDINNNTGIIEGIEVITPETNRYKITEKFNEFQQDRYTLKTTEGLYIIDTHTGNVYELTDSIQLGTEVYSYIFSLVNDTDREKMILNL